MRRLVALVVLLGAGLPFFGPQLRAENQALIIEAYRPEDESDPRYNCFWDDSYCLDEILDTNLYNGYLGRQMPLGKMTQDQIHLLWGSGQDPNNPPDRYKPSEHLAEYPIVDAAADTYHIRRIIDSLGGVMGSSDTLFVYLWGHGGMNANPPTLYSTITHTFLNVRRDSTDTGFVHLWDTTFARMMRTIDCGRKVYVMSQCFSGGFVDDLIGPNTQILSASKEWTTNCVADNHARGGSPLPEMDSVTGNYQYHGEFNFHFLNAIRGRADYGPRGAQADLTCTMPGWSYVYDYVKGHDSQRCPLFQDTTYWSVGEDMPDDPRHKSVKAGGSLAALENPDATVYAFKGGNTCLFYSYAVSSNSWVAQDSIPKVGQSGKKKGISRGGALAGIGGKVYATKGNNTCEFWRYDPDPSKPAGQHWAQLTDVPPGAKSCKDGTALAAASVSGTDYVYLLKGAGTREFYRYDVAGNAWAMMDSAPSGISNKGYKRGSCLADDGTTIWALKGAYNEFAAYNAASGNWVTKETLPRSPTGKRVKEGAALAAYNGRAYALKGGNTLEFWRFDSTLGQWSQASSFPGSKKIQWGGAMTRAGACLWALRGRNTKDFFCYTLNSSDQAGQGTSQSVPPGANEVQIAAFTNVTAASPRWSTDGSWVAYCRTDQNQYVQLYKKPANGGQEVLLTTSLTGVISNPVWSPDGATIAFEYAAAASAHGQIATVSSSGGQVTVLTSAAADCGEEGLCWALSNAGIYYARDSAGNSQLAYVPATGGAEQILTTSEMRHSCPSALSSSELIYQGEDASDGSSQIFRLNLQTAQEVQLTSGDEHSNPAVAPLARLVAAEVDQDGLSQIAVLSADGGSEAVLTSGSAMYECPSLNYSGSMLHCLKTTDAGSAICEINGSTGTLIERTDDEAERETPNSGVMTVGGVQQASACYVREGGDIYRTAGTNFTGGLSYPRLRVNPNAGTTCTDMPCVVLRTDSVSGPTFSADSMRFKLEYYSSPGDSEPDVSSTTWSAYHRQLTLSLGSGDGKYRITGRYRMTRFGFSDTSVVSSDSMILNKSVLSGSFALNHGTSHFTNTRNCTLCTSVQDSSAWNTSMKMRYGSVAPVNLLSGSSFSTWDTAWHGNSYAYDSSLKLVRLHPRPDTVCYLSQLVPVAAFSGYSGSTFCLSADLVKDSFPGTGSLELYWRFTKINTKIPGPMIQEQQASQTSMSTGFDSKTGDNHLATSLSYFPLPPPSNYTLTGLVARVTLPAGSDTASSAYLDNIRFELSPQGMNWATQDSLVVYDVGSQWGTKTVFVQFKDQTGNQSQNYSDTICLDIGFPVASITFPDDYQVITDTIISVLGLAYDPTTSTGGPGHFLRYKFYWKPDPLVYDTVAGILPESLFFTPQATNPDSGIYWRTLADWHTQSIIDRFGPGDYQLTLVVIDSALNQTQASVTVYLDTAQEGKRCAISPVDDQASAIAATQDEGVLVGTTEGKLVSYSSTLDSITTTSLADSAGPAVITGVTTDESGNILVTDARDKNVKVCDEQGNPTDTVGNRTELTVPNCVQVARNGEVWVADRARNTISVYDENNTLKRTFGSTGTDTAQFEGAYGLALSYMTAITESTSLDTLGNPHTDTITITQIKCLVADKGNHRIQTFDTTGHYLTSFGEPILSQPVAITTDTNGCCYVADQGNKAIYGFSPNGDLYLTISASDTMQPAATTLSQDNATLYTLDQKTHSLIKYLVQINDPNRQGGAQNGEVNPIQVPKELILEQSWPNPATRTLTIRYGIPKMTSISLKVYDISGKLVRTLQTNDKQKPGYYNINWDCKDNRSREIAGGVYFYRLVTGGNQQTTGRKPAARVKTRKLVIAK